MKENPLNKTAAALREPLDRQTMNLGPYETAVQEGLIQLEKEQFLPRLWRKDPSLWKKDLKDQEAIRNSLGWLHVAEKMAQSLGDLLSFATEAGARGFRHVLHMGMGGSSLAPLVFENIFAQTEYGLPLTVLDTTDPATILAIEKRIPVVDTLFIVASKSGTTAEVNAFGEYFYSKVNILKGPRAGDNFTAITDPGTPLARLAHERGFRRVFLNDTDIGGRYSALSYFGLVPAVLMGVDVEELLARVLRMARDSASSVPAQKNPGVVLGAAMAELARRGRDKVTFLVPESIAAFGLWLEQLLAESTGKEATGILPVSGEPPGLPSSYGEDRLFVFVRLKDETDELLDRSVKSIQQAGLPLVTIRIDDRLDLGREFYRWEIATATAGAILGINAFDQPNVQESKDNTNRLLAKVGETGKLTEPPSHLNEGPLRFYGIEGQKNARELLRAFFSQARPGDYLALQAYLSETASVNGSLQAIRQRLRDTMRLATTLGYGPRYLHSTGQYHKGGPNTGLFIQLIGDEVEDAPVPGAAYTFGLFKHAQALGDLEALKKHGRRVLRVHLGRDVLKGLTMLRQLIEEALPLS